MKKLSIFLMMLCFACFGVANAQTSFFSEDFEGGSMPSGWTTDGPGSWSVGSGDYSASTGAGQGTYNALITHGTTGNVTKLITPAINLASAASAELSFMHIQRSWSGDIDQLRVYYRTSSSGSWTQLVAYTSAVSSWTTESEIALPNPSGTYQLAFEFTDKYGYGVGLDDINIEGELSSCPAPSNLRIVGEVGPRSITMGWDAESGVTFQYAMVQSHNIDPTTVTTFDGTTTTNEMTWNNLTPDTDYTVILRKMCGTNDYSAANALEFHTPVACPAPTGLAASNPTSHGATLSWTGFSNSYVVMVGEPDTQGTIQSIDFETGDLSQANFTSTVAYPFTVVANTHSGAYCAKSNNGGMHSTTADMVLELNMASEGTISFSAMVSSETNYDKAYFSIDGTTQSDINGISGAGSWIDYEYPLTAGTHTLRWYYTKDGSANSNDDCFYVDDIEITGLVPSTWSEYTANTTSITINDLDPATSYFAKVKGNCGSDGYSQETSIIGFTTLESCPTPTALNVAESSITAHEATLTWTADNDSYNIMLGEPAYLINADFEDNQIPANFTNSTGNLAWSVVANDHSGAYCAKSASGNNSATSAMEVSVTLTNDLTLTFSAKVSSESGYDFAYFSIDGTNMIDGISGAGSWIDYSYPLTAGTHTLRWFYTKDSSVASNDDCFYVDDIQIIDGADVLATYTSNTTSYSFTHLDAETIYTVQVQGVCGEETTGWSEAINFTTAIACQAPTNLVAGTPDAHSVELNWTETGSATAWEICLNGDEDNLIPADSNEDFLLEGLTPDTEYTLKVRANCGGEDGASQWSNTVTFTTTIACPAPTNLVAGTPEYHSVDLSWTAGGNETAWQICVNGDEDNLTDVTTTTYTLSGLDSDTEYTVKVRANCGSEDGNSQWSNVVTFSTPVACAKPTSLGEDNITYTTVDLSWTGSSDSYVAEYGTWTQVGTDHITTATLTPYTFDLSDYSGTGTVAIRHYNVTDMFRMNVDDIVVTNANGTTVYSQNFESGSIPSNMSNIDLDGDGNDWYITSSNINGSYGVTSASWVSGDALTPDNWLVISDVQLGGSITFKAIGQDPSAVSENFGVFVIADNQFTQAYSGTDASCQITGLTEGTAYVWRVKGICDGEPSKWVSSMFKTKDDLLVFATDGDWDDLTNWTDADGNAATALPTVDNKVRIDADAIITEGVVATAKSAVLNNGSIEIEEGGQLKQGSTVKVTMHKGIMGYTTNVNYDPEAYNQANYYFIATPHSCSYFEENTVFPYVLNVTDGEYDLYAFDPTQELEWVNFESSSSHSEFHTGDNTGLFNKKGYLYANADDKDLIFVGTVSSSLNNTLADSYTYSSTSTNDFNGWKLVGNPFTCNAYISYVNGNGEVLEANFYTMNIDGDGYDLSQSSVALAPLTGALINYNATGTIQFASEAPTTDGKNIAMINISLVKSNKTVDQARVRFGQGFNLEHKSFRNNSKIYMPVDNNEYAVVYTEEQGEMPVNFKAENNGTYTISINTEEISFGYLHLIDNMTGNDVDLLATPSYTFEAKTTDYESRFKLVFATGNADDNFAFYSNGSFVINNEGNATLQVIDINGRILKSESINGCANVNVKAAAGVYMLRLVNGDNVKVQKVVVR